MIDLGAFLKKFWLWFKSKNDSDQPFVVMELPEKAMALTGKAFESSSKSRIECCCFWYGVRDERGNSLVKAVIVPRQKNTWGNYNVPSDAMVEVSEVTRRHGWKNLAQIHTHPGRDVRHSLYDDENAVSQKSLSIVVPNYGINGFRYADELGVHECQKGSWRRLSWVRAQKRMVMKRSSDDVAFIDLR
jgi:hypothetical protein